MKTSYIDIREETREKMPDEVCCRFALGFRFYFLAFVVPASTLYLLQQPLKHSDYWGAGFMAILWIVIIHNLFRQVRFKLSGQPAFTANKIFIYDHFKNKKYFWEDIEEVEISRRTMYIYFYDPQKYGKRVGRISAFLIREGLTGREREACTIDLEHFAIPKRERQKFLDKLDRLSIANN